MMKKIVLAALASAIAFAGAGSANATTTTAAGGVTFTVGVTCTISSSVANVGQYSVGDTVATYQARQGTSDGSKLTAGSDTAATLAVVTCPTGTAWSLGMPGGGPGATVAVQDPSGAGVFNAVPTATAVSGTAVAAGQGALNASNTVTGTGTGAAQTVTGFYPVFNPTAAQLATKFVAGTYSGTATATLTY